MGICDISVTVLPSYQMLMHLSFKVVLRWNVQRGCSVIPQSSNQERIKQNLDLFGFALDDDDIAKIKTLNRNLRFNNAGEFCEKAFGVFCPIYE